MKRPSGWWSSKDRAISQEKSASSSQKWIERENSGSQCNGLKVVIVAWAFDGWSSLDPYLYLDEFQGINPACHDISQIRSAYIALAFPRLLSHATALCSFRLPAQALPVLQKVKKEIMKLFPRRHFAQFLSFPFPLQSHVSIRWFR